MFKASKGKCSGGAIVYRVNLVIPNIALSSLHEGPWCMDRLH